jgi:hypothetical protein
MHSFCGGTDKDGINVSGEGTGDDRVGTPLRRSSTVVLRTSAAPHIASGPCARGVTGTVEFFEYAGYAGVVGVDVVLPPLPIKASSVSLMDNILLSRAGGRMLGPGGGAYVIRGTPEQQPRRWEACMRVSRVDSD